MEEDSDDSDDSADSSFKSKISESISKQLGAEFFKEFSLLENRIKGRRRSKPGIERLSIEAGS